MSLGHCIAQLRHLYSQMVGGDVRDPARAAKGLLGPVIAELERIESTAPAAPPPAAEPQPEATACRARNPARGVASEDDAGLWCSAAGPMDAVCDLDRNHPGPHRGWSTEGRLDWLPRTGRAPADGGAKP